VERDKAREAPSEPPARIVELLSAALWEIDRPDPDLARRLALLTELVFTWSARMNLTGYQDREAIARGLVLDALGLASMLPDGGTIVDLGSGAGFPGLPLALARPGLQVTLVESRQKRHHFQRTAIRELSIPNAKARLGRAEALEPSPHHVAIARAIGPVREVITWMLPWLEVGGLLLIPVRSGSRVSPPAGAIALGVRSFRPPLGGPERWVWIGSKSATP
jgi:16S rRNA (guanine527-N7)-methyltransferase